MITEENTGTIYDLVKNAAREYSDKVFMKYERNDEVIERTYLDLYQDSQAVAAWVMEKNNEAGRKMNAALLGRCSYRYVVSMLAVPSAGNIVAPLDVQLNNEALIDRIERADVEILFYDWEFRSQIDLIRKECKKVKYYVCFQNIHKDDVSRAFSISEIIAQYKGKQIENIVDSEDIAMIIYTSGTTGLGKGVMLSNGNLINNAFSSDEKEKDGVCMNVLPIHHVFCIGGDILMLIRCGHILCICPELSKMIHYIHFFKPTYIRVVPMMAKMLLNKILMSRKEGESLEDTKNEIYGKQLRRLISGGGYLAPDIAEKFFEMGITTGQGYGMSECSPKISAPDYGRIDKLASVGRLVKGCKVRIVDGEIQVQSPSVMKGYYKDEERTKEAITEDGWLRTGDLGYVDEEGFLYLTGRKKNLIILTNGENVSPELIENQFDGEPLIMEILVYGDESIIAAEVYPNYEYAKVNGIDDIQRAIEDIVNKHNLDMPTYSRIVNVNIRKVPFEKNSSKKIVREKFFQEKVNIEKKKASFLKPSTPRQEVLFDIVSKIIGHTMFGIDSNLYEHGLDSMGSVLLIEEVHNRLNQTITLNDLLEHNSIVEFEKLMDEAEKKNAAMDFSKREEYPLTGMQKYFAYYLKGNTTSNLPFTYQLDNSVDLEKLKNAISDVIDAHPGLKANVRKNDAYYSLYRQDDYKIDIPIIKMEDEECLKTLRESVVPFEYTKDDDLCHIALYETDKAKYIFLDVAHLMGDGVSMNIIMEDINKRYLGEEIEKEDYTVFEYVLEEQVRNEDGTRKKDIGRISKQLKGIKLKRSILNKKGVNECTSGENAVIKRRFDKIIPNTFINFCKENSVTENVMFLTGFNYCISLYADEDDVLSNSIHSGRTDSRWTRLVGPLFLTYFFRYTRTPHEKVSELLKKNGNQIMDCMKSFTPVMRSGEMFFQYQGDILNIPQLGGKETKRVSQQLDSLPFHMQVMKDENGYYTELRYWKNRFDRDLLEMFVDAMEAVIVAMMEETSVRRLKKYLPENLIPKHYKISVGTLKKEAGFNILPNVDDDIMVKVYVLDENYCKNPYGAWGSLYIKDYQPTFCQRVVENPYSEGTLFKTDCVARIMPDGEIDFLANSGKSILTEGLTGRRYYNLNTLENALRNYPDVLDVCAYLDYDSNNNQMKITADLRMSGKQDENIEEKSKEYVKEQCGDMLVPVKINI